MLKARVNGKKPLLIFGISKRNVELLKKGKPIAIDLSEMGIDAKMMLFYSETEDGLVQTIAPYITKETKIHEQK